MPDCSFGMTEFGDSANAPLALSNSAVTAIGKTLFIILSFQKVARLPSTLFGRADEADRREGPPKAEDPHWSRAPQRLVTP